MLTTAIPDNRLSLAYTPYVVSSMIGYHRSS